MKKKQGKEVTKELKELKEIVSNGMVARGVDPRDYLRYKEDTLRIAGEVYQLQQSKIQQLEQQLKEARQQRLTYRQVYEQVIGANTLESAVKIFKEYGFKPEKVFAELSLDKNPRTPSNHTKDQLNVAISRLINVIYGIPDQQPDQNMINGLGCDKVYVFAIKQKIIQPILNQALAGNALMPLTFLWLEREKNLIEKGGMQSLTTEPAKLFFSACVKQAYASSLKNQNACQQQANSDSVLSPPPVFTTALQLQRSRAGVSEETTPQVFQRR